MIRLIRLAALGLFLTLGLVACGDSSGSSDLDIVDTAIASGEFDTLVAALEATGLDEVLRGDGPFTVFAPNDAAFARLPAGVLDALLNDPTTLEAILLHHVVAGEALFAADVVTVDSVETALGDDVLIDVVGAAVLLDGIAQVAMPDIEASNGVIHQIDGVMLPVGTAFPGNIVEALSAYPVFSNLVDAVVAEGLGMTLMGDDLTVFAPTNYAFDALAMVPPNLRAILEYHVVTPAVDAVAVIAADGSSLTSVEGSDINVNVSGGGVTVGGSATADIVRTDLQTTPMATEEGYIHVIDAVMVP